MTNIKSERTSGRNTIYK